MDTKVSIMDMVEIAKKEHGATLVYNTLRRLIKKNGYWDVPGAEDRVIGKQKTRFFPRYIMEELFNSENLYDTIHCRDQGYVPYHLLKDKAEKLKKEQIELEERFNNIAENDGFIEEKYHQESGKFDSVDRIMLQALYNLFFEPFPIEEYYNDLRNATYSSPGDIDEKTVLALKKLENMDNYVKRKGGQTDPINPKN